MELLFYRKVVKLSFLPLLQDSWDQLESYPFADRVSTKSFSTAMNPYNLRGVASFGSQEKTCGTCINERKFILKFPGSLSKKDTCFARILFYPYSISVLHNPKRKARFKRISIGLIEQFFVKQNKK